MGSFDLSTGTRVEKHKWEDLGLVVFSRSHHDIFLPIGHASLRPLARVTASGGLSLRRSVTWKSHSHSFRSPGGAGGRRGQPASPSPTAHPKAAGVPGLFCGEHQSFFPRVPRGWAREVGGAAAWVNSLSGGWLGAETATGFSESKFAALERHLTDSGMWVSHTTFKRTGSFFSFSR